MGMLIVGSAAWGQMDQDVIKYRQKLMGSIGAHMGSIGDILKKKVNYSPEHIRQHALGINASSKLVVDAFKQEAATGKTDAQQKIWGDWSEFEKKAQNLQQQSEAMAKVAASGDMRKIGAQMKKLGGSCGGCHKNYRKPKKESYKNKM